MACPNSFFKLSLVDKGWYDRLAKKRPDKTKLKKMTDPGKSTALFEPAGLKGQVQSITFMDEDTGYVVATLNCGPPVGAVTVVGNLLSVRPGEVLEMKGRWERHPKYGRQFRVMSHTRVQPTTTKAIERYLGSGLIKGIGPEMARRIVKRFGKNTLDVIENSPGKLAQVEGIGPKRVEMIKEAWGRQKEIRDLTLFLQEHGLSPTLAQKIFKAYGEASISLIRQNPFRLAGDIHGIGFKRADAIAAKLGFEPDSPVRVETGVIHVLQGMAEEGHLFCPYQELVSKASELLGLSSQAIGHAIEAMVSQGRLVREEVQGISGGPIYLKRLHAYETGIKKHLLRLLSAKGAIPPMDLAKAVRMAQKEMGIRFGPGQIRAIQAAFKHKVLIITGGPGTGKTTILDAVVRIARRARVKVALAAPTGRAAKRMEEATAMEAKTIHRLLEYQPHRGGFQRGEHAPIDAQLVIIDEVSMLDVPLAYHLFGALSPETTLILVGDKDQLPSVGPGNLLGDLLASGQIASITLQEIFRQAAQSLIVVNAHRINRGQMPLAPRGDEEGLSDFYLIEQDQAPEAIKILVELVTKRIPARFGLAPLEDIQVISPMRKGLLGTTHMNQVLQDALNPRGAKSLEEGGRFRVGDRVMQIRNNYEKEVFNGDIGHVKALDPESGEIVVLFDGRAVVYEPHELDELSLAYAITVHKSQGSEYPAVILVLTGEHYIMLQRNLLYTAVTRAKKLLVIVGQKRALAMAVRNKRSWARHTLLAQRLRGLL